MQSIQTKFIPATNFKGSRIKATCERGSIFLPYPHELDQEQAHIAAADALIAKFVKEDVARYGTERNPWTHARVCGCLKGGTYCHTFLPIEESGQRKELCPAGTMEQFAELLKMATELLPLAKDGCGWGEIALENARAIIQKAGAK